ncbi:MAG: sialidase family protein, partial [Candidatus Borkfalkiaceae bacterium]|nr:sialidase family protein [Christensenellaceae bacterium]
MKKKFCLIIALCMAMSVCLGLGFTQTKANAAETNAVSGLFRMKDGASVRVVEPYGIRFTTEVGNDYTASLESVHSGKTFKFGTLLKITVDGVTKGMNIDAEKFVDTTAGRLYNTVVTDIPEGFFNTFITAESYVKVYDGETLVTTYYADNNGQTRSAAQVASGALADGKTDAVLSEYVKNVENFSFGGATGTLMLGKSDLNDYLTVNPSKITPVYKSGDETVATVDKNGIVTAKKTGEQVLITATLGTKSASCTFTVGNEGVIYQSEEKLGYCGWPSVAKIYDDKLISVWSLRQTHRDPYGKVVGAISEDNGVTWSEPFTIIDTVLDDRDAGVIFWKNKVIVSTVSVAKSIYLNSGNQEWIDYTNAITDAQEAEALGCNYVIGEMVNGELTFGAIKKAPSFTPHGMIQLANGELGYVGYDGYDRENGITKSKIVFCSSADGETWSKVSDVFGANEFLADQLNEPNAIVLKNGKMIVAVRSESNGIYLAESDDGGVTFSNKRVLLPAAITTPPHLMQTTDGTLVLSYGYRNAPYNIRAIVSKDNGESWSNEIELTSGGVDWDFGYPSTIERGNGELLTVYYQKLSADKKNTALKEVIWTIPENLTYGDKAVVTYDVTSAAFALRADAQATTLTVGEEGGENVITYTSTASEVWDARAQLSGKMLDLVTANRQLGGKALTLDFKYEGDVSTLQLWYYTPGIAAKTLKELIDDKVATLAHNGYSIGWERVSKGVWYTLYVDLDKFATAYGEIVYSNTNNSNNCGLQAATKSTLKVKGIEFI